MINVIYLPMAIISGTFFSPERLPEFLRVIAEILPLTHYTKLTRNVMVDDQHIWSNGGAVARGRVWGAIGLVGRVARLPLAAAGGLAMGRMRGGRGDAGRGDRRSPSRSPSTSTPAIEIRVNFGILAGREATPGRDRPPRRLAAATRSRP